MKRLTDGMKNEMYTINQKIRNFHAQFIHNARADQYSYMLSRLKSQYVDELETYKVKLENFYSETDVKEKTFHDFQFCLRKFRIGIIYRGQDCFPVNFIR